jgi:hypothetical protein
MKSIHTTHLAAACASCRLSPVMRKTPVIKQFNRRVKKASRFGTQFFGLTISKQVLQAVILARW